MLACPARCWTSFGCLSHASTIVKQLRASIDTTLTPPGTQYGATRGKAEKEKPFNNAGFATLGKPLQRVLSHS